MTDAQKFQSGQYLTFNLDKELYALDIDTVREVLEVSQITNVPQTREYMRGVINVRGHAVPVADLRTKFGMDEAEMTVDTCIIIIDVRIKDENIILGVLVDGVEEVLEIEGGNIEPPPRFGVGISSEFIKGIGKVEEKFIIILDAWRVFSEDELDDLAMETNKTEFEHFVSNPDKMADVLD